MYRKQTTPWSRTLLLTALCATISLSAKAQGHQLIVDYAPQSVPALGYRPAGLVEVDRYGSSVLYQASDGDHANQALSQAALSPRVLSVSFNMPITIESRQFVPNDPFFGPAGSYRGQWNLINSGSLPSANLPGAWAYATGRGVVIGIVDDGIAITHPDLAPNFLNFLSHDFASGDSNPAPLTGEWHGTQVAGVAVGRGGNAIGITGVAPWASAAGIRIGRSNPTNTWTIRQAIRHQSEAIKIKIHGYGMSVAASGPKPYMAFGSISAAQAETAELGMIHVRAAGNGRGTVTEDANKWDLENDPTSIAVAAVGPDGRFAPYSAFGANVFVSAPSRGQANGPSIPTTAVPGRGNLGGGLYASDFGGTSAAAAVVGGVIALGCELTPEIDVRVAKHLIIRTAAPIDSSNPDWIENGAGFRFNPNYGHGLIDATAFVEAAGSEWSIGELERETVSVAPKATIPDNQATGLSRTFELEGETSLEEILLNVKVTHSRRGDLEAFLTSPSGTTVRLFTRHSADNAANFNWTFSTSAFWGETPAGTWTLRICDRVRSKVGKLDRIDVEARMGDFTLTVGPNAPTDLVAEPSYTSVDLTWTDNSEDEDGFSIWQRNEQGEFAEVLTVQADQTEVTLENLAPDTDYAFQVRAFNGNGQSRSSNTAVTRTLRLPQPEVRLERADFTSLDVDWPYAVPDVTFEVKLDDSKLPDSTEPSYSFEGLTPATRYLIQVRAKLEIGNDEYFSSWSRPLEANTLALPVPQGLRITDSTFDTLKCAWEVPSRDLEYEFELNGQTQTPLQSESPADLENLVPNTTYRIRIRSVLEIRDENDILIARHTSEWSAMVQGTTQAITAPSNPRLIARTAETLTIGWDHPGDAESFSIEVDGTAEDSAEHDARQITIEGLNPSQTYRIRVGAEYCDGEHVAWSNVLAATTADGFIAAPSRLEHTHRAATRIIVRWQDNSDNEERFEIQVRRGSNDWEDAGEVDADVTNFAVEGLRPNTAHRFRVRAAASSRVSDWSNVHEASTLVVPPTDVRIIDVGRYFVRIAWNHPGGADKFEIQQSVEGGHWGPGEDAPGSARSAARDQLQPSTHYRFRIRAWDQGQTSSWVETETVRVPDPPPTPPRAPSHPRTANIRARSVDVLWNDNSNNETEFEVLVSTGREYRRVGIAPADATRFRVEHLEPDTEYWFKVRAVNSAGASDLTERTFARTRR